MKGSYEPTGVINMSKFQYLTRVNVEKRGTSVNRVYSVLFFGGLVIPIYFSLHLERVKGCTGQRNQQLSSQPMEGKKEGRKNGTKK